ncbi:hypothetical protein [Planococcus versutus]|nr:hypothetical protein [Planococcus versutus]
MWKWTPYLRDTTVCLRNPLVYLQNDRFDQIKKPWSQVNHLRPWL